MPNKRTRIVEIIIIRPLSLPFIGPGGVLTANWIANACQGLTIKGYTTLEENFIASTKDLIENLKRQAPQTNSVKAAEWLATGKINLTLVIKKSDAKIKRVII